MPVQPTAPVQPTPAEVAPAGRPMPARATSETADGAATGFAGESARAGLAPTNGNVPASGQAPAPTSGPPPVNGRGGGHDGGGDRPAGCTAPQLRRFIKSRPYVPMHELRRRFAIDGGDDDVTQVRLDDGHIYVGLPSREGSLLGELLRGGEIGYELSLDPRSPIVVGVYPMRPVPRG